MKKLFISKSKKLSFKQLGSKSRVIATLDYMLDQNSIGRCLQYKDAFDSLLSDSDIIFGKNGKLI